MIIGKTGAERKANEKKFKKDAMIRKIFILAKCFLLSICLTCSNKDKDFDRAVQYHKFKNDLEKPLRQHSFDSSLIVYQSKLRGLLQQLGYSNQRVEDSIWAICDRQNFDTLRYYNKEELEFYKEFRRALKK